jgi:hypothetical protein
MEIQLTPARKLFFARLSKAEGSIVLRKRCSRPFRYGRRASAVGSSLSALDVAEGDLQTGNFSDYGDESLPRLAEELKGEARSSLKSSF